MLDHYRLLGNWKIKKVDSPHKADLILENVKFCLDEAGDVIFWINDFMPGAWDNPTQIEEPILPLLQCDSYEINTIEGVEHIEFIKEEKPIIEFILQETSSSDNFLMTSHSTSCTLSCSRLPAEMKLQQLPEYPFSFITAFNEGFFSDITITADDNKKFKVHSIILKLSGLLGDANRFISLDGLPQPLLKTILYWGYGNCLHPDITIEICQEIIKLGENAPVLRSLMESCQTFISNMELKKRLQRLVSDMHSRLIQCVKYITCTEAKTPLRLCQAFKNSFKEIAVACAHFMEFSLHLQAQRPNLNSIDRHEIVRYAYSLFPTFVKLLFEALKGAWDSFKTLSVPQKQDLALYLIPEIEGILNSFTSTFAHAKLAVEKMIDVIEAETSPETRSRSKMIFRNNSHVGYNEVTMLRIIHSKIAYLLLYGIEKRDIFAEMNHNEKLRCVTHNFDMMSEEFPLFIFQLHEVTSCIEEKYDAYEFNFGFKVTTKTVADILKRAIAHPELAEKLIEQMCSVVQRDRFTDIMKSLGLLKGKQQNDESSHTSENSRYEHASRRTNDLQSDSKYQLNLGKSLHSPPSPEQSLLARKVTKLLYNGKYTDMEFVIIPPVEDKLPMSASSDGAKEECVKNMEKIVIKAHRVIVAARCPWFRRALLSGMREDRDRKIEIYDTSPVLFKELLHYLYGNGVSQSCLSNQDSLSELMLLADRYEVDDLKKITEFILLTGVDDDSAIYLLSIADQINADSLKTTCLEYISLNPKLMKTDLYAKLSDELRSELDAFVNWLIPSRKPKKNRDRLPYPPPPPRCPQSPGSDSSDKDSFEDIEEVMSNGGDSSPDPLDPEGQLPNRLASFRDIVGPGMSDEGLVNILLAADFDVNRAVNFYYSDQNV